MSVFKSQYTRALVAYKSDNADIAYPNKIAGGTNTTSTALKLINSAGLFITKDIKTGDVVHNETAGTAATVVSVDSETQLTLNANIFTTTAQVYSVYSMSSQTSIGNTGCNLYVGGAGNVSVITIGGDKITFNSVPAGTTLPIQVIRLIATGTTATNVNALW